MRANPNGNLKKGFSPLITGLLTFLFLFPGFFFLYSKLNKTQVMEISMPEKPAVLVDSLPVNKNNLFIVSENQFIYSIDEGNKMGELKLLDSIQVDSLFRKKFKYILLIKPYEGDCYRCVVDIFDKCNIYEIKKYALVSPNPQEKERIEAILSERKKSPIS